ncbi:MAG: toxic anion resistance protein [Clostridiales bacterium]|nr:toxic anion resistance protein [Clostridiales bacterium]
MVMVMENQEKQIPSLTLDPFGSGAAQAAQAAAEAPAAAEAATELNDSALSEEEKKAVEEFSQKIDITDSTAVLQYGAAAQQKISAFSDSALESVKTKDFGELGDMIAGLVTQLKGFSAEEEEKGFFGFFKKQKNKIASLKAKYDSAEASVNNIVESLEQHQIVLMKDVAMLDKMYEMNLAYFKELTMYILAGKKKLETERSTTLAALREKAQASGLPEDAQAVNDFESQLTRFEKKLYDLELTRTICIQMAPQIRMVQNNDTLMTEKIQSVIVSTIPLWKNQMVLSLGIEHSNQAMEAQRAVSDMTNELLRRNAETLKQGSIDIAKESERGIVELETLQHTNQQLIATLDEVQRIQAEGKEKRAQAEKELGRIEGELRAKLMENGK